MNQLFFHQWQRKLVALFTAVVIWIFVSHSITATKTISSVPIRVINLPPDQTINGLLPNGFLSKRTSLNLTGTKNVIEQLEPGDVEVLLDISNQLNEGIVQITKKNLISLNPGVNLYKHVTFVSHPELIIKMSPMATEKIPVRIFKPIGVPPEGYQFLDIWPTSLMQTVSGPQEAVLQLKNEGLDLIFNLNDIDKAQLDAIQPNPPYDDVVSFSIPNQWKKILIPFSNQGPELVNDLEAKGLHLDFLRQQSIPIKNDIPVHVFYPLKYSSTINPQTYALETNGVIQLNNQIPVLKVPLFATRVSKLFFDIIKDNIEIDIVTAPQSEREKLEWGVSLIDESHLEDTYVAFLLSQTKTQTFVSTSKTLERERYFRKRFRNFSQQLTFCLSPQHILEIESRLDKGQIKIHVPYAQTIND